MTHAEAQRIVEQAWQRIHGRPPTALETLYTQAIAWGENQYGRAKGQFNDFASAGKFNWGSLHARGTPPNCPANSVEGFDVRPVCFLAFPADVDAAAAFVRVLTRQHWPTVTAMEGTPEDVAAAMRVKPAYYEGAASASEDQKIAAYAQLIRRSIQQIDSGVTVPAVSARFPWLLALGLAGGAGYLYYRRNGVPAFLEPMLAKVGVT